MRTFSAGSLALLLCVLVAGCSGAPTSPSAALGGNASEGATASDVPGSLTLRTLEGLDEEIAGAKPTGKATNLNLKGIVSAVDDVALTMTVSSKVINVPATAEIVDAVGAPLTFADITVNKRVHVTGKTVAGVSTAKVVRVLDYAVKGTVSLLDGICPTVTFTVGHQDVATTATTAFQYGGCDHLADGMTVEVQGTLDLGVLTALKVVLPAKKPVKNVRVKGTVSDMEGACPTKTFMVGDNSVKTTSATIFTGSGKCAAIADGKKVDITGVQEAGYIRAVRLNVSKK